MQLTIAIIDDHKLFTELLFNSLSRLEFIKQVYTFNSPKEFIRKQIEPYPDIILMDLLMPELNGAELLTEIRAKNKEVGIIIVSSVSEAQSIKSLLRNGANGYVDKSVSIEELTEAILQVHEGARYISSCLKNILVSTAIAEDEIIYQLSPQQRKVLQQLCSGKTVKEIAFEMKLSAHTIQAYQKNIMRKFNVNRTIDLIMFAMKKGLCQGPEITFGL